jgi:hypothetical protein
MEKIKVVIDRSKWRTGGKGSNSTGEGNTRLLNQEGFMCCLGFCCQAAGVSVADLYDTVLPHFLQVDLREALPGLKALIVRETGDSLSSRASIINDYLDTTPDQKEQKLLELFKDSEFEIEFTGDYPKKEENV